MCTHAKLMYEGREEMLSTSDSFSHFASKMSFMYIAYINKKPPN